MRVVAGSAGGIRLATPRTDLRPTMDRVKAAIFSSLAGSIPGARVLDLFAGTGALGIEALSRGAAQAVFVESDARAIAVIEENLRKTRQSGEVIRADVLSWIEKGARGGVYDFVFADPPYRKDKHDPDFPELLLANRNLPQLLTEDGVLVLEHSAGPGPGEGGAWEMTRSRSYGSSAVSFFRKKGASQS